MKPTGLENIREEKFWQEANARKNNEKKFCDSKARRGIKKHKIWKNEVFFYLLPIALSILATLSSLLPIRHSSGSRSITINSRC